MKQMDQCLDRFFEGKKPLHSKKWKAFHHEDRYLFLMHYHHLVLVFDFATKKAIHRWAELPTDSRGLNAALAYLEANPERLPPHFLGNIKEEV